MSEDTSRQPRPEPDDELKRLAARGRAKARQVPVKARSKVDRRDEAIRLALCRVYMPPLRRAALGAAAVGGLLVVGAFVLQMRADQTLALRVGALGLALLVGGLITSAGAAVKRVTPAQLEMERAWLSGLPFRLEGYFDILAQPGEQECHLQAAVAWTPGAAGIDHGIVLDVWRAHDPHACSHRGPHGELGVNTGPIVAQGFRRGRLLITYGNGKIPVYVHQLVTQVLLPLHRRRALLSVSLKRG